MRCSQTLLTIHIKKGKDVRGRGGASREGGARGRGRGRGKRRGRSKGEREGEGREKETNSLHILWEECCASEAVGKVSPPAFRVMLIEAQVDPANRCTREYQYWGCPIHHTEDSKNYS